MELTCMHIDLLTAELVFLTGYADGTDVPAEVVVFNCVVDRVSGRMKYNIDPDAFTDAAWWLPASDAARDNKQATLKHGRPIVPPAGALRR